MSARTPLTPERLLLIGPPPYREGGSRVSFEILLEHLRGLAHMKIDQFDLPVHHPLYSESGAMTPTNHIRTVARTIRAVSKVPLADTVIIFGAGDVSFSYGLAFVLAAKLCRKHCVVRLTGGRALFGTKQLPAFIQGACLAIFRMVDAVVVQTEVARRDFPPELRMKTTVVKGFRPPSSPLPSTPRKGEKIRFACFMIKTPDHRTSRTSIKGLDVLLDAVEQLRVRTALLRRIEVNVYGPLPALFGDRVKEMPGVVAHGYLPNSVLRVELSRNDVLAFPSRYTFEGHPGAIIEAFMVGIPVISTDLPGPSEIVRHEENGLVVRTGDVDAFAAAMAKLVTDDALRRRLSKGAQASAADFAQERVLPQLTAALGVERPVARTRCADETGKTKSMT